MTDPEPTNRFAVPLDELESSTRVETVDQVVEVTHEPVPDGTAGVDTWLRNGWWGGGSGDGDGGGGD